MDPAVAAPDRQRLAGVDAEIVERRIAPRRRRASRSANQSAGNSARQSVMYLPPKTPSASISFGVSSGWNSGSKSRPSGARQRVGIARLHAVVDGDDLGLALRHRVGLRVAFDASSLPPRQRSDARTPRGATGATRARPRPLFPRGGLRLELHPGAVGFRRLHRRFDEGDAFDAVDDGREVAFGRRLLALARRFDRQRDLGIDVGEAFEIALRMAAGRAGDARRRGARAGAAAGDDARRLAERRPAQFVGVLLRPVEAALGPVDAQPQAVLVAGRDLARPQRAARAVGVAQQDLRVVVELAARRRRW